MPTRGGRRLRLTRGTEAWCPRCDELRAARPGTACPVCGRAGLLALPAQPGQPGASLRFRASRQLRGLLPATRIGAVTVLVLATVAGAFAAGRLTRSTPAATAAPPTTTVLAFGEDGPITGRRDLGWRASDHGITVTLRGVTVGVGFTRLELTVAGLRRRLPGVNALDGLRVQDSAGNDLLPGGEIAHINTTTRDPGPGGSVDTDVVLDRAIDHRALARVQVRGLTIADNVDERLDGVLVDPELQRNLTEDGRFLQTRPSCPSCRVKVDCLQCRTIRVAGTAYHRDQVLLWLEPVGPTERSGRDATVQGVVALGGGDGLELTSWTDGLDGDRGAVVAFSANELANRSTDADTGKGTMAFDLAVSVQAEQPVRGRWVITQPGSSP
ncbi:MAG TPA: hypothetical protein VFU54_13700 [Actinomycetota bacterium]|nr:hypothetical protein [Actinomycetota bacterium]